ncbi:MAG: hypothetical protein HYS12_08335 [Planctomycetes bacterium]|nr:hypothetical protein [Planctomycetota bacterium]
MESQQDETRELTVLRQLWGRWTAVVELFARKGRGRRRVDPAGYHTLHHELVAVCQTLATAGDKATRPYYANLEALSRPWLTCRVLEQADREILLDLLLRCQQVQRELVGESWAEVVRRWFRRVAVVMAVCLLPAALAWGGKWIGPRLDGWWRTCWLALQQLTNTQLLVVGGTVAVLIAAALMRVSRR